MSLKHKTPSSVHHVFGEVKKAADHARFTRFTAVCLGDVHVAHNNR